MALTLAPLLDPVTTDAYADFYFKIADGKEFDYVCIGEIVCNRRVHNYDHIIRRLKDSHKKVIFATPLLLTPEVKIVIPDGVDSVEIHDFAALSQVNDIPVIAGEQLRIYNQPALDFIIEKGFSGVVLPQDLPVASLAQLTGTIRMEVIISAHKMLGLSARCNHARYYGKSKKDCSLSCRQDSQGVAVYSLDNKPLFIINGPQTLSYEKVEIDKNQLPDFDYRVDLSFSSLI